MDGPRVSRVQNPVRGLLHGTSALVSTVGLVALLVATPNGEVYPAAAIYGFALVGLYTTSSLYHSVPWREVWKARLQRLDHTMIYVLVAATFTPLLVAALDGPWVVIGLLGAWGLATLGLAREMRARESGPGFLAAQIVVGSACLIPLWLTLRSLETTNSLLVLGGGVIYLVGVVMFVNSWPRLIPGVFSHHELWHVFVIVASAAHFAAVWQVVTGG